MTVLLGCLAHRTQGNRLLTFSSFLNVLTKDTGDHPMEDAQGKAWGWSSELPCALQTHNTAQIATRPLTRKFSEPHPLGLLWSPH